MYLTWKNEFKMQRVLCNTVRKIYLKTKTKIGKSERSDTKQLIIRTETLSSSHVGIVRQKVIPFKNISFKATREYDYINVRYYLSDQNKYLMIKKCVTFSSGIATLSTPSMFLSPTWRHMNTH